MKRVALVVAIVVILSVVSGVYAFHGLKIDKFGKTPLDYDPVNAKILPIEKQQTHYKYLITCTEAFDYKKYLARYPEDAILIHYIGKEEVIKIFTDHPDRIKNFEQLYK